jgi:hypothetical protein
MPEGPADLSANPPNSQELVIAQNAITLGFLPGPEESSHGIHRDIVLTDGPREEPMQPTMHAPSHGDSTGIRHNTHHVPNVGPRDFGDRHGMELYCVPVEDALGFADRALSTLVAL